MRTSVIVATYNEPDRLALVLAGIARQSVAPGEVLIADDGSGPDTARVVAEHGSRLSERHGCRVEHVWHADDGFRKWAVCNEAVRRSSGEWLCFLDGDSIPHRHWLADHVAAAPRGDVLCGRRVKLGPSFSARVTIELVAAGVLERPLGPVLWRGIFGDNERVALGVRLPAWLARAAHPRPRKLMGVNFSLARRAFEGVNGYDEEWPGRRGDRDLDLRLQRGGWRYVALINRAIVYHLHHTERASSEAIQARVREEERSARVRCRAGLSRLESDVETSV